MSLKTEVVKNDKGEEVIIAYNDGKRVWSFNAEDDSLMIEKEVHSLIVYENDSRMPHTYYREELARMRRVYEHMKSILREVGE